MISQSKNVREVFKEYFRTAITPKRILELGTGSREFTHMIYMLRKEIDEDFDFITVDFTKYITSTPEEIWALIYKRIIYLETDIFSHVGFIGNLIIDDTLVLCDNGDKPREVRLFTPYLKSGCVIMAHDYFYDMDEFKRKGGWPVCEITYGDVSDLGLIPYHQDLMKNAFWLSLIKP